MALKCAIIPVTPFQQNASIVWCTETMRAAVVDPGGEVDRILEAAAKAGVTVEKVLLTHGHLDHAAGAGELARRAGVEIEGPDARDRFLIEALPEQGRRYGFAPAEPFLPDRWLEEGETVTIGSLVLDVLHCPGHTPGHIVYIHPPSRFAIVGDVLFQGSIGRTDLPGGNHEDLIRSIRSKLWPLGNDITFLPGHGPPSTFGIERERNPFVADALFERR